MKKSVKKIITVVVLLAIIVVVVVFGIKRMNIGGPKPPEFYFTEQVQKIDLESKEIFTLTRREWLKRRLKDGKKFKNPNTGEYTVVSAIKCPGCGKLIPSIEHLLPARKIDSTAPDFEEARRVLDLEKDKITSEYKCPECGMRVYSY